MNAGKLSAKDIVEIRKIYAKGKTSYREIASAYDVSANMVCKIVRGVSHKKIFDPESQSKTITFETFCRIAEDASFDLDELSERYSVPRWFVRQVKDRKLVCDSPMGAPQAVQRKMHRSQRRRITVELPKAGGLEALLQAVTRDGQRDLAYMIGKAIEASSGKSFQTRGESFLRALSRSRIAS